MNMNKTYNVAVLGATGAVGRAMVETLEKLEFPVGELRLLASTRSAGTVIMFRNQPITVQEATEEAFAGIDIALFSAGAGTSKLFAPLAVRQGAVVIDNSSAYRMDEDVPLVVPEVNPDAIASHQGIIANPNCSTIQLVVALKPLLSLGLEYVSVATYQAVSGMGQKALDALREEVRNESAPASAFPVISDPIHYPMARNVLPQCDVFLDNGYTKEEMKLVNESRKILGNPHLQVSPTAVRVPVEYGHSEAVTLRFKDVVEIADVRSRLQGAEGVVVVDDPASQKYPHPRMAEGTGDTYVGRIRRDLTDPRSVLMFIVADNLLKGAAWNAVQIASLLVK
jgi:aspartate-semialdehyde dehydrogenase